MPTGEELAQAAQQLAETERRRAEAERLLRESDASLNWKRNSSDCAANCRRTLSSTSARAR